MVTDGSSLSADPNITDLLQREHPKILTQIINPLTLLKWALQTFGDKLDR